MNIDYKDFITSIQISNIRLLSSNEKVLFYPEGENISEVKILTEKKLNKDDPRVDQNQLINQHKYKFDFSISNKIFYSCDYEIYVDFEILDIEKVSEALKDEQIKKLFIEKQIDKLVWSYLRGIVMDGFNKHSLTPIPLPLLV